MHHYSKSICQCSDVFFMLLNIQSRNSAIESQDSNHIALAAKNRNTDTPQKLRSSVYLQLVQGIVNTICFRKIIIIYNRFSSICCAHKPLRVRRNTKTQMLRYIFVRKRRYIANCKPGLSFSQYALQILKYVLFGNKNPHIKAEVFILRNMHEVVLNELLKHSIQTINFLFCF